MLFGVNLSSFFILYFTDKNNGEKPPGISFSWMCFFLPAVLAAIHTDWDQLDKSSLTQEYVSAQQANPVCQSLSVKRMGLPVGHQTKTSVSNYSKTRPFYTHTHTHTKCKHVGWVIVFALQKFKRVHFTVYLGLFILALFFLMEIEERKMKSIFNVYGGAWPNSLHSAEKIFNKLIFNEQPLCMGAK